MMNATRRSFFGLLGTGATLSLAGAPSAFSALPPVPGDAGIDPVIVLAREVEVLKGVRQRASERFNEVEADALVEKLEYIKAVRDDDEAFNRLHDAYGRLALTPATTLAGVLEKLRQIYDGDASDQADVDALETAIADLERMSKERQARPRRPAQHPA